MALRLSFREGTSRSLFFFATSPCRYANSGFCLSGEVFDESSIVSYYTQESAETGKRGGRGPLRYVFQISRTRSYTVLVHMMSQIVDLFLEEFTFGRL